VRPKAVCAYYQERFGVDMSGTVGWAQVPAPTMKYTTRSKLWSKLKSAGQN
jgi:hypothetical protein